MLGRNVHQGQNARLPTDIWRRRIYWGPNLVNWSFLRCRCDSQLASSDGPKPLRAFRPINRAFGVMSCTFQRLLRLWHDVNVTESRRVLQSSGLQSQSAAMVAVRFTALGRCLAWRMGVSLCVHSGPSKRCSGCSSRSRSRSNVFSILLTDRTVYRASYQQIVHSLFITVLFAFSASSSPFYERFTSNRSHHSRFHRPL